MTILSRQITRSTRFALLCKLAIYCVNFGVNFILQKFCLCKKKWQIKCMVDTIVIVVTIYDWSQEVGGQLVSFLSYVSQGACQLWDYMDGSQVIFIRINPLKLTGSSLPQSRQLKTWKRSQDQYWGKSSLPYLCTSATTLTLGQLTGLSKGG